MSAGVCAGALVAIGARPDEAQDALHEEVNRRPPETSTSAGPGAGCSSSRRGSGDNIAFPRRSSALAKSVVVAGANGSKF